jgi:membrane-bound lytic murein transglycosylase D
MTVKGNSLLCIPLTSFLLYICGCGTTQQSRFQMAFLPSVPHQTPVAVDLAEPPPVAGNPYLTDPAHIVTITPQLPPFTRAAGLMKRAEQHLQRGRKFYQAHDLENARQQFDAAIDLMLQASDNSPNDRHEFQHRFEQMVDAIHRYDMAGMGAGANLEDAQFEKAPFEDLLEMTFPVDPKLKDRVQEQVQATVSQLPLTVNDAVAGYIHYFEGRGHRTLIAGLERAGRYRPMVQRILDEEGIPQELIHLAQAESGFIPRAVSRKQATGMWQFVSFRGQQYGLNQSALADDRLDPEKATRAAARHLHDLYTHFGDWYLAIAAYNCGPVAVDRAVERTGYADFWELRNRGVIPIETTNYVPIILAMTIMEKNAAEYGLDTVVPDPPLEYDTIELTSPTHLLLVADLTDAPTSELLALNPALLKGIAPAGYSLRVPKGTATMLQASLEMMPAEKRALWRMHRVVDGETLADVGKRYGVAVNLIAAANKLPAGDPVPGDLLVIPAAARSSPSISSAVRHSPSRHTASTASGAVRHSSTRKAATTAKRKPLKPVTHTAQNGA